MRVRVTALVCQLRQCKGVGRTLLAIYRPGRRPDMMNGWVPAKRLNPLHFWLEPTHLLRGPSSYDRSSS